MILPWFQTVGDYGTVEIKQGDTVTWLWTEVHLHTVECRGTSSGAKPSGSYSLTFPAVGSYPFSCQFHNSMRGTISVRSNPSQPPTMQPTVRATLQPTQASSTQLTLSPTVRPTAHPTEQPTVSPTNKPFPLLIHPDTLTSGDDKPREWNVSLYVRSHRVVTDVVSFNTRIYCYQVDDNSVCSYPGPTIKLAPGDNFTLLLINELDPNSADEGNVRTLVVS
jgi:hypothetical protein